MRLIGCVSALSVLSTIILHSTGIITCRQIVSNGSVGTLSHLPFLAAALMGGLWAAYGVLVSVLSLILVNLFIALVQSSYFFVYYVYSENVSILRRDGFIAAVLFISPMAYYYFQFTSAGSKSQVDLLISDPNNAAVMGIVCNIFTIVFFASPLVAMSEVIRSKETASMSLPLSVMSAVAAFSWSVYGVLMDDMYLKVPNMIGFLLAVAQLFLFVLYPRKNTNDLQLPSSVTDQ